MKHADYWHLFTCYVRIVFSISVTTMITALKDNIPNNEYNLSYAKYLCMFYDDTLLNNGNEWDKFVSATLKLFGFPEASAKSLKVCYRFFLLWSSSSNLHFIISSTNFKLFFTTALILQLEHENVVWRKLLEINKHMAHIVQYFKNSNMIWRVFFKFQRKINDIFNAVILSYHHQQRQNKKTLSVSTYKLFKCVYLNVGPFEVNLLRLFRELKYQKVLVLKIMR